MTDLATLGFSSDSSGLKPAISDLEKLPGLASKAETAAVKMGANVSSAMDKVGASGRATDRLVAAIMSVERAVQGVQKATSPLAASLARIEAGMGSAAARAMQFDAANDRTATSAVAAAGGLQTEAAAAMKLGGALGGLEGHMAAVATSSATMATGIDKALARLEALDAAARRPIPLPLVDAPSPRPGGGSGQQRSGWDYFGTQGLKDLASDSASKRIASMGSAFGTASAGAKAFGKDAKAAAFEVTNIGYQVTDMSVMMSGGMGAGRTLATQLPQLLAGKNSMADLKALGAGVGSFLLNPITLATVAVTGLGFAFDYFTSRASDGLGDVETAFEKHAATIKGIRDLYGDMAKSLEEMSKPTSLRVTAATEADKTRLQALLQSQAKTATSSLFSKATDMTGEELFAVNPSYAAASKAVENFRRSIDAGRADFTTLLDTVDKLYLSAPGDSVIEQLYKNVHKLGDEGEQTQRRLEPLLKTVDDLKKGFGVQSYLQDLAKNGDAYLEYKFERDQRTTSATRNYGFDMRDVSARTASEKARLAADRARAAAETNGDDPDLAASRASNLVYAQTNRQNADSDREWKASMDQRIASQRLGLMAIGSTAEATDAARIKLEEYAQIEREALTRGAGWAATRRAEVDRYADALVVRDFKKHSNKLADVKLDMTLEALP